jgi:hypothetical protein
VRPSREVVKLSSVMAGDVDGRVRAGDLGVRERTPAMWDVRCSTRAGACVASDGACLTRLGNKAASDGSYGAALVCGEVRLPGASASDASSAAAHTHEALSDADLGVSAADAGVSESDAGLSEDHAARAKRLRMRAGSDRAER